MIEYTKNSTKQYTGKGLKRNETAPWADDRWAKEFANAPYTYTTYDHMFRWYISSEDPQHYIVKKYTEVEPDVWRWVPITRGAVNTWPMNEAQIERLINRNR